MRIVLVSLVLTVDLQVLTEMLVVGVLTKLLVVGALMELLTVGVDTSSQKNRRNE
jgi:hypothetical protein